MLWSIFKFFFNVARTLSLLFTIALFAFLFYLSIHPDSNDRVEALFECAKERELSINSSDEIEKEEETESIEMMAIEIFDQDHVKKMSLPLKKRRNAYLRPTQIMYVHSDNGAVILQKNDGEPMLLNMKKYEFDDLIRNYAPDIFFSTRSSTFNLNHIDRIDPVSTNPNRKHVVMEDEKVFSVSNEKINQLKAAIRRVQVTPNIFDNSNY